MTLLAAGILLSSALALAGPGQAAPDCKTSTGTPACPAPKAAKPPMAAKTGPAAEPNAGPKPRPEPEVVRRAAPSGGAKETAAQKPRQHLTPRRTARPSAPHRTYAQTTRVWRHESRQDWKASDEVQDRTNQEYRPRSGPVYESASGAMADGYGCDYACQYRAWFERYSAWYDRYGRTYSAQRRGAADYSAGQRPAHGDDGPATRFNRPDQGERDRLDPWHGYNGRDGLENGY